MADSVRRLDLTALIKAGGLAAARAFAEKARRDVIAQVDQHAREVQARRNAQIAKVYGKLATSAVSPIKSQERSKRLSSGAASPGSGLEVTRTLLGEGATSRVYLGRFGPRRSEVAAKVVRKEGMTAEQLSWIRDEIAIHKQLRHPHVVTMHGANEAPTTITIVLALCRGGSLCDTMGAALEGQTPIDETKVHRTFTQLCGALHYCHRHGVVHRDIKLDNLCWADEREERLKLIDFGYAAKSNLAVNFAGSPHYVAPEVHAALGDDAPEFVCTQADVFSCGVCLFAMLATQLPFGGGEDTEEEKAALSAKSIPMTGHSNGLTPIK
ncbi:serine threonine [Chrysochromulina tobinii]|uniref:Serine threonine n=1 Tax=Chrysochromulina tobinii TaxID=1460289 RepID=A0A0M0K8B1_9EUKA|nr:serine threonine [Chrysochromulina tobinii]|eukprot:KOO34847.1 serine threonine [Chrysochromulina sp. CCMP291]